ncbi:MAG: hypothetical protein ACR2KV_13795 [Solirubrobacteraceae bacterium]
MITDLVERPGEGGAEGVEQRLARRGREDAGERGRRTRGQRGAERAVGAGEYAGTCPLRASAAMVRAANGLAAAYAVISISAGLLAVAAGSSLGRGARVTG